MKHLLHIPLLLIVFIIYNIVAFAGASDVLMLKKGLFQWTLFSGAELVVSLDLLLMLLGLMTLFLELLKSTRTSVATIIDHSLSTILFIAFLLEFLLVPRLGTEGFLILTTLSLIDVIAGFTISISSAKRDFSIER